MRNLEISCDESGYEGRRLIGGTTDVFAHASVSLGSDDAEVCIRELRDRIRSPAVENKANHLLRQKHRDVLLWFLGAHGPIRGAARVHLVDKTFLLVCRLIDYMSMDADMVGIAHIVYRTAPSTFGRERWETLLGSFNDMMRSRDRQGRSSAAKSLRRHTSSLEREIMNAHLRPLMERMAGSDLGTRHDEVSVSLDPLIPAIGCAAAYWSNGQSPIAIIHDRQNALTRERITSLVEANTATNLTSVTLVDSRSDPRVQVADFLAGVARKVASEELNGRGDDELTRALRPYVGDTSIWGDDTSWSRLAPTGG